MTPDRAFELSQIPDMMRLAARGLGVTVAPLAAARAWHPSDGPDARSDT
ncbi:DNA-binding transcriptional LysR family regulator [Pseudoclavibacter chungangensis]|nr:DNA-binding transcriptional LysR family regulator [Pseudoclavibacter chungangensis]